METKKAIPINLGWLFFFVQPLHLGETPASTMCSYLRYVDSMLLVALLHK